MRRRGNRILTVCAALALCEAITGGCAREHEPPNILIVVLDTVRSDYVGWGTRGRSVTPNLDRLSSEATVFRRAWANAPWTVPSHVSMFTGLLPSEHGCTGKSPRFESEARTLAEALSDAGYETAAFFSNPWLTDNMTGMLRGFDTSTVAGPEDIRLINLLSSRAQGGPETVANVDRWLGQREAGQPFLALVNLLEAHLPYAPPADYRESHPSGLPPDDMVTSRWAHEFNAGLHRPSGVDWDRVRYLYAGDVHTSDSLLGRLVEALEQHGLSENTVVIVTSDHGENLGDHGLVDHQFGVFETLLAVPLVIRAPGRMPAGERVDPVMLTDVFATVLDLAGVEDDELPPCSRSLLGEPAPADRAIIAEYAGANEPLLDELEGLNAALDRGSLAPAFGTVRVGDLRLTVGSDGSVVLHDLAADPGQTRNLAHERPRDVEALRQQLPAFVTGRGSGPEVDEHMREWLRALGYVM